MEKNEKFWRQYDEGMINIIKSLRDLVIVLRDQGASKITDDQYYQYSDILRRLDETQAEHEKLLNT